MQRLATFCSLGLLALVTGCGDASGGDGGEGMTTTTLGSSSGSETADDGTSSSTSVTTIGTETQTDTDPDTDNSAEWGGEDFGGIPDAPNWDDAMLDLLIVVDNSGSMAEEQARLAAALPQLIDQLLALDVGVSGPSVQVMVTSTDVGHPLCAAFAPDGYAPLEGAPQTVACVDRLADFTGLGADPVVAPEACTASCPVAVTPADPFVHAENHGAITNVPGNDYLGALGCLLPQGINGCGYESPLEAMLQALNPDAAWNQGPKPFVRDDAVLAIVLLTDEADCSVRPPEGYAYFTDPAMDTFWEVNPDTGTKTGPTSAVCWNAGVDCGVADMDGFYADCMSLDTGVLHPIERYTTYLGEQLGDQQNKPVVMLALVGVPSVTAHAPRPPFQPTAGGVLDLVYREWVDEPYPMGPLLPGEDAATNEWLWGIGPGCTAEDGMGGFTGQALPPARVREVCEALDDFAGDARCSIESICDLDYSGAGNSLVGLISYVFDPFG